MKKSNLFLTFTLLVSIVLGLAGCVTTQEVTEAPTTTQDSGTTSSKTVEHKDALVASVAETAQTRAYNENFDELVEDFSTGSAANVNYALRVLVDSALSDAPVSADASIYKIGTGVYDIDTYDGIGFKIRTVGEGTLDLSNLVLALRGDDSFDVYELCLADCVNADGESLPTLSSEYQEFVVCPTLSIEDDTVKYKVAATGADSEVKVLEQMVGFHLYSKGECSQVIEISEVFLVKGADKTVLDTFNREKPNKGDAAVCWWRDSKGFIVQKGVLVKENSSYTANLTETTGANLVLSVMGDTTGTTVGGVAWANLKDANGNAVANAVNGGYASLVINLQNSGITSRTIEIASTTEVYISKVFASDLNDREAVTVYPSIDAESASMFDNFDRTQSGFNGDYEASSTDPIVTGADLVYALSYSHGELVSIADGVVTFDATTLPAGEYIQFKEERIESAHDKQHYLVFVMKASEGANFDNFRFDCGSGVIYYNDLVSAFGLQLPKADATNYCYTDEDGFMWVIVDLAESNITPTAVMDIYYSGTGKVEIDCIFYADEVGRYPVYTETKVSEQGPFELTAGAYVYAQGFSSSENLVKIVFSTESEDLDLSSLRIEGSDGAKWFKDGQIIDSEGNAISGDLKLKDLTIIVDLTASGLDVNAWNHIHSGNETAVGTFSYTVYSMHDTSEDRYTESEVSAQGPFELTAGAYVYAQGFSSEENLVKIVFSTESEDLDLSSIRIEGADGAKWFKDGQIKDADGNVISGDLKLKNLSIVIDLTASGLNVNAWNHIHSGNETAVGTFSYTVYSMHDKEADRYTETELVNQGPFELTAGAYVYAQGFSSEENLVKIIFQTESEDLDLSSIRIEGADGAKWFKDGQIKDADGNVISGDLKLKNLSIVIDLTASGLNVNSWNHIHSGNETAVGTFSYKVYALHDKEADKYTETEIGTQGPFELTAGAYVYAQGFSSEENLVKISFTTESTDLDLSSIRIEGADGAKWFKDGQIKDADGNVISGDLKLKNLSIVIDLTASGLNVNSWNHIHSGNETAVGTFSYTVYSLEEIGVDYAALMEALEQ